MMPKMIRIGLAKDIVIIVAGCTTQDAW